MGDFFHGALALGILGLFLGVDFQSLSFVKAFADFFWGIQNKKCLKIGTLGWFF